MFVVPKITITAVTTATAVQYHNPTIAKQSQYGSHDRSNKKTTKQNYPNRKHYDHKQSYIV